MKLSRKRLLGGAAASALGAAGVYELVDRLSEMPVRVDRLVPRPPEQHVLAGLEVVVHDRVEVVVPPLHHRVLTARLTVAETERALRDARETLGSALEALDADFPASPAGLAVTVAWGLPYFERFVPGQARDAMPVDVRATAARGHSTLVLEPAERFPSDPPLTRLEENDLAILLRSDRLEHLDEAHARLLRELEGMVTPTSVRKGFMGGGFGGGRSLPKRMAVAARVPGADLIPETAQLYLGFTSTQAHALGAPRSANLETLGYADLRDGYFAGGTHMHLSHIHENVSAWYVNFDRREQVEAMFRPGIEVRERQQTVAQDPRDAQSPEAVKSDHARHGLIGHAGAMQSASRLAHDVVGPDGTLYAKGSAVPHRADFNTLDNPFAWSIDPDADGIADGPDAGLHFVIFNPTSDDFRRVRLAMDGVLPDGTVLVLPPRSRGQGVNSVLHATHRQNFLVPPRAHRSFPLSERRA